MIHVTIHPCGRFQSLYYTLRVCNPGRVIVIVTCFFHYYADIVFMIIIISSLYREYELSSRAVPITVDIAALLITKVLYFHLV